mmetsp:Transcript_41596/g.126118  ORF Transcript_41596/g.126118 Transcript_41596/m.126118 type:complete len:316 (-) Transcript_41596:485-1432(-)
MRRGGGLARSNASKGHRPRHLLVQSGHGRLREIARTVPRRPPPPRRDGGEEQCRERRGAARRARRRPGSQRGHVQPGDQRVREGRGVGGRLGRHGADAPPRLGQSRRLPLIRIRRGCGSAPHQRRPSRRRRRDGGHTSRGVLRAVLPRPQSPPEERLREGGVVGDRTVPPRVGRSGRRPGRTAPPQPGPERCVVELLRRDGRRGVRQDGIHAAAQRTGEGGGGGERAGGVRRSRRRRRRRNRRSCWGVGHPPAAAEFPDRDARGGRAPGPGFVHALRGGVARTLRRSRRLPGSGTDQQASHIRRAGAVRFRSPHW